MTSICHIYVWLVLMFDVGEEREDYGVGWCKVGCERMEVEENEGKRMVVGTRLKKMLNFRPLSHMSKIFPSNIVKQVNKT